MLNTKEAAKKIGKSEHWLRVNADSEAIPRFKVGGRYCYDEAEIDRWLDNRRVIIGQTKQKSPQVRTAVRNGRVLLA